MPLSTWFLAHGQARFPATRDARNAFTLQQALASDGIFVIRERRPVMGDLAKVPRETQHFEGIGLLVASEGSLRFVVTWPLGQGRRATFAAIESASGVRRAVYSDHQYEGEIPASISYDLSRYAVEMSEFMDTHERGVLEKGQVSKLTDFSLESAGFTDYWQRVR